MSFFFTFTSYGLEAASWYPSPYSPYFHYAAKGVNAAGLLSGGVPVKEVAMILGKDIGK